MAEDFCGCRQQPSVIMESARADRPATVGRRDFMITGHFSDRL
jgi:hypothetical protein